MKLDLKKNKILWTLLFITSVVLSQDFLFEGGPAFYDFIFTSPSNEKKDFLGNLEEKDSSKI